MSLIKQKKLKVMIGPWSNDVFMSFFVVVQGILLKGKETLFPLYKLEIRYLDVNT